MDDSPPSSPPSVEYTLLQAQDLSNFSTPFDSMRDTLIASTLAPLAVSQEDLKKDYSYQFIEFRDKRTSEKFIKEKGGMNKITMTKQQVDTLRSLRSTLKKRRDVSEEMFRAELTKKSFLFPPYLSHSTYYTEEFRSGLNRPPLDFPEFLSRLPSPRTPSSAFCFASDDNLYNNRIKRNEALTTVSLKRADVERVRKYRKDVLAKVKEAGSSWSEFRRELETDQELLVDILSKVNDPSPPLDLSWIHDGAETSAIPQAEQDLTTNEAQLVNSTVVVAKFVSDEILNTSKEEEGEESELVKMDFESSKDETEKGSQKEDITIRDIKDERSEQAQASLDNRRIRSPTLTSDSPRSPTPVEEVAAPDVPSETTGLTNEEREKFLRGCRLGPAPSSLPPLMAQPLAIASLGFVNSSTDTLLLSYSLIWNSILSSEEVCRSGPLERTREERVIQRNLKRTARDLRENMTEAAKVGIEELTQDMAVDIDGMAPPYDGSQDLFAIFHRSPSPDLADSHPASSSLAHATDIVEPQNLQQTTVIPSVPKPNPPLQLPSPISTWPSQPPLYTVPRRRARSAPIPPRSSFDTPIILLDADGKGMDTDEFGYIGATMFQSSSPPPPPSSPSPMPRMIKQSRRRVDALIPQADGVKEHDKSTIQIDTPRIATPVVNQGLPTTDNRRRKDSPRVAERPKKRMRTGGGGGEGGGKPSTTFRLSELMSRFMHCRTQQVLQPESASLAATSKPATPASSAINHVARAPSTPDSHSSPPPGSIPFSLPPFLSHQLSSTLRDPLRVVIFDPLLQMRPLYIALQTSNFQLVPRPSRFPSTRYTLQDPHLILSGTACVSYFKLIDLIGNAVREDPLNSTILSRQESVLTTLCRFAARYERILVILEERQYSKQSKAVKAYSYTTPVLEGLRQLAKALEDLQTQSSVEGKCLIEVAISKGPEHSAELTRKFAEYLEGEDEKETRPGMKVWGDRSWLLENPVEDESDLLRLSSELNEISASATLSNHTAAQFVEMYPDEAIMTYSSVCGEERIRRILGSDNDDSNSNSSDRPSFARPAISNLLLDNDTSFSPYKFSLSSISARRPETPDEDVKFEDVFDVEKYDSEK